jgi:hypothetical protein
LAHLFANVSKQTNAQEEDVQILTEHLRPVIIPGVDTAGHLDLRHYLAMPRCYCLNEKSEHPWQSALNGADANYLESDSDPQLLLCLVFTKPVKIFALQFRPVNLQSAPKTIKLYSSRTNVDFCDLDSLIPTQVLNLTPENFKENAIVKLNVAKWHHCSSIVLFIEDNMENVNNTAISYLRLIGSPIQKDK